MKISISHGYLCRGGTAYKDSGQGDCSDFQYDPGNQRKGREGEKVKIRETHLIRVSLVKTGNLYLSLWLRQKMQEVLWQDRGIVRKVIAFITVYAA